MKYDAQPLGWVVAEDAFNAGHIAKCESIFAQGNGYINLRNALEENYVGQRRGAFITGTFNKALPDEVTELPNLPDVTELRLTVNGERFSMETGTTENYCRKLDLRTGETERTLVWTSPAGARLALRLRRSSRWPGSIWPLSAPRSPPWTARRTLCWKAASTAG